MTSLTISKILAQCSKHGACRLWNGSTNGEGYPFIYDKERYCTGKRNNGMVSGRVAVWELSGEKLLPGHRLVMTCNTKTCLAREHMVMVTIAESIRLAAQRGAYRSARHKVAAISNARRAAKLTRAKAAAIRAAVESGQSTRQEQADLHNIDRSSVDLLMRGERWKDCIAPNASVFAMAV